MASIHGCHLLSLLEEDNLPVLEWYERKCTGYIGAVEDVSQAIEKIEKELLGTARTGRSYELNAKLADLFVEIAAVNELSKQGYSAFMPLVPPPGKKGQTASRPDFQALTPFQDGVSNTERHAYIEAKNLRAPRGLLNTFSELIPNYPSLAHCFIRISHYWDNTIQEEQEKCIDQFLCSLAANPAPLATKLQLPGSVEVGVEVLVVEQNGGVGLVRSIGGDHPSGPFTDLQALKRKATDTIRKAVHQLTNYALAERIVALNISTADAMLSAEMAELLRETVRREGKCEVKCLLFHHYQALSDR